MGVKQITALRPVQHYPIETACDHEKVCKNNGILKFPPPGGHYL